MNWRVLKEAKVKVTMYLDWLAKFIRKLIRQDASYRREALVVSSEDHVEGRARVTRDNERVLQQR